MLPFLIPKIGGPWAAFDQTKNVKEHSSRTTNLTRSDFTRLLNGNVRLITLSFTVLERYVPSRTMSSPFLMSQVLGFDKYKLRRVLQEQPFTVFREEYEWFTNHLTDPETGRRVVPVRTRQDLQHALTQTDALATILSIEGAHNLGFEYADDKFPTEHRKANFNPIKPAERLSETLVDERLTWLHERGFFIITLNHFVYNQLASMPMAAEFTGIKRILHNPFESMKLMGKTRGLTFLGYYFVRKAYEMGFIIDVKHCDAVARKQIYTIAVGFNRPVVGTHVAVSGRPTNVQDHQLLKLQDRPKDRREALKFNPWDINLHDDDILALHRSGGLIGLILDSRVLGSVDENKRVLQLQAPEQLLFNQIEHVYRTLVQAGISPTEALDSLCIGGDLDGLIEPIRPVPTAEYYLADPEQPRATGLDQLLTRYFAQNLSLYEPTGLTPEQATWKILRDNQLRFFMTYLPEH
jgi:microsomal dipeptidase-like Zn-dependent dipeptidase